ncbi:MAG: phosphoadenylyl-sulfate reductase [Maricaulaceae bacterium]
MLAAAQIDTAPSLNGFNDQDAPDAGLGEKAAALNARLRGLPAEDILRTAILEAFRGEIALVSSFGTEAAVMLHMVSLIDRTIPLVFLDTGMHFPQTLDYRDELIQRLGLSDVRSIEPNPEERAEKDPKNMLWKTDPDACCGFRKVTPLDSALAPFSAWITGRKRFHGGSRGRLAPIEFNAGQVKVNPLIEWDPERIDAYFTAFNLPRHPMMEMGYRSIGCWPCTQPSKDGEGVRSGRWQGQQKTECGIHKSPAFSDGAGI